ncbi:serine hydrolase FSH, partial [Pyrenochaeta sp. MPI-SDFR-AT-0127]
HLPTVLCLHGAGTNSKIFQMQTRTLIDALQTNFRFVFVDAPFESRPGPGVIPLFANNKPYLWWHCDENAAEQFDITVAQVRERRLQVRGLLASRLQEENVVGIMAFSQGTRVATGLCLDSELGSRIKFAILIAATFPALPVEDDLGRLSKYLDVKADVAMAKRLRIPSVHVQGSVDPWAAEGDCLRRIYYDDEKAVKITFKGGHTVPVVKREVSQVVKAVAKAW